MQAVFGTTEGDVQALIAGNFPTQATSRKDAVAENGAVARTAAAVVTGAAAVIGEAG